MASNKHKGILSLQQVLDSILNDGPENGVSKEESSEEEFGYNDIVTEDGIGSSNFTYKLLQSFTFYPVAMATCLVATAAILSSINTLKYSKSPYNA